MGLCGAIWGYVEPSGASWGYMGLSGPIAVFFAHPMFKKTLFYLTFFLYFVIYMAYPFVTGPPLALVFLDTYCLKYHYLIRLILSVLLFTKHTPL